MPRQITEKQRAAWAQALSPVGIKRGDLVVTCTEHSYVGFGKGRITYDAYELWIATSVTREGRIKALRSVRHGDDGYSKPLQDIFGLKSLTFVAKTRIEVAGAIQAAREHHAGSDHGFAPFRTLDEVRDALRPCLIKTGQ